LIVGQKLNHWLIVRANLSRLSDRSASTIIDRSRTKAEITLAINTRRQQNWSDFISQGGTTREDLVRFMHGERLGSTVHEQASSAAGPY
jgi:hypothetical protein